jgi:hypothetical protein
MTGAVLAGRRRTGAYVQAVLADAPVGLWLLDEASGTTAANQVGGGAPATYSAAGIAYHAIGPSDEIDYGITTNGSSGYVTLPDLSASLGTTHAQSYEVWVSAGPVSSATARINLWGAGGAAAEFPLLLGAFSAYLGNEVAGHGSADPDRTGWTSFSIAAGWHHLAATYSGTQDGWVFYLDGSATGTKASYSGGSLGMVGSALHLGRYSTTYSAVSIAAAAVYDTELSASSVSAHYEAGSVMTTSPYIGKVLADSPLGLWMLDEVSGTTAADSSGNGRDATYTASGMTYQLEGVSLAIRRAVRTNGSSSYVTLPDLSALLGTDHAQSYEIWVNTPQLTKASARVNLWGATNLDYPLAVGNASASLTDETAAHGSDEGGRTGWGTALTITAGWHHMVATFSGTQDDWLFYVDGTAVGSKLSSSSGAKGMSTTAFTLGKLTGVGYSAVTIAAVAVYDTQLSAATVLTHYQAGA